MPQKIDIERFLLLAESTAMIDVRSPAEFRNGHIPGAINIPLFNDEERAIVGTLYKQKGSKEALIRGLEITAFKMKDLAITAKKAVRKNKLLVYCWRGGMRSAAMAWWFEQHDIQCEILDGGYKSFRRYVLKSFDLPYNLRIVGGYTGSGKTEILKCIKEKGEQVLDLEGLAHHKGSAFGNLGELPQPKTEHFENLLYHELSVMDSEKVIWVEDESHNIGKVFIPNQFFNQMREAPAVFVKRDLNTRLNFLVKNYGKFSFEELKISLEKIKKRIGGQNFKEAVKCLENGDYRRVAEIALFYYDKTYEYGINQRNREKVIPLEIGDDDPPIATDKILQYFH